MPVLKEQVGTNERVILGGIDLLRTQHIIREQDMARMSKVLINGAKYDLFNHTCGHVLGTRGSVTFGFRRNPDVTGSGRSRVGNASG